MAEERYLATVTIKGVRPNFPPGSGSLVDITTSDGKEETKLHYRPLIEELAQQSGIKAEDWPGTQWEYDFFNHRLLKLVKGK